jgi:hypothetical protein
MVCFGLYAVSFSVNSFSASSLSTYLNVYFPTAGIIFNSANSSSTSLKHSFVSTNPCQPNFLALFILRSNAPPAKLMSVKPKIRSMSISSSFCAWRLCFSMSAAQAFCTSGCFAQDTSENLTRKVAGGPNLLSSAEHKNKVTKQRNHIPPRRRIIPRLNLRIHAHIHICSSGSVSIFQTITAAEYIPGRPASSPYQDANFGQKLPQANGPPSAAFNF